MGFEAILLDLNYIYFPSFLRKLRPYAHVASNIQRKNPSYYFTQRAITTHYTMTGFTHYSVTVTVQQCKRGGDSVREKHSCTSVMDTALRAAPVAHSATLKASSVMDTVLCVHGTTMGAMRRASPSAFSSSCKLDCGCHRHRSRISLRTTPSVRPQLVVSLSLSGNIFRKRDQLGPLGPPRCVVITHTVNR